MSKSEQAYHLGVTDQELARLGFQHQVWQEVTQRLWALGGFGPGQTLLDLGCGPGYTTLELARLAGKDGRVYAVDEASRFTQYLERCLEAGNITNVTVEQADVQRLSREDASTDGAFARWLLCFVENPRRVCEQVARVLRPGGRFVIWDYFNYRAVGVFPERAAIRRLFDGYYRSALKYGGSYDIGHHLPAMLIDCGFELEHLEPINRVARPGSKTWAWVSEFNRGYLPKLVESELLTQEQANEFKAAWREAEADPSTFFFSPPMLGIVAKKI